MNVAYFPFLLCLHQLIPSFLLQLGSNFGGDHLLKQTFQRGDSLVCLCYTYTIITLVAKFNEKQVILGVPVLHLYQCNFRLHRSNEDV